MRPITTIFRLIENSKSKWYNQISETGYGLLHVGDYEWNDCYLRAIKEKYESYLVYNRDNEGQMYILKTTKDNIFVFSLDILQDKQQIIGHIIKRAFLC